MKRPPRKRRIALDNLAIAARSVQRMRPVAVAEALAPVRQALQCLRTGSLSEDGWTHLVSANNIALSIERQGVVRGLRGHLEAAEQVLAAVHARATGAAAAHEWRAVPSRFEEVEVLDTFADLYRYQLEQLSYGEFQRATQAAIAEVLSSGGRAVPVCELREGV